MMMYASRCARRADGAIAARSIVNRQPSMVPTTMTRFMSGGLADLFKSIENSKQAPGNRVSPAATNGVAGRGGAGGGATVSNERKVASGSSSSASQRSSDSYLRRQGNEAPAKVAGGINGSVRDSSRRAAEKRYQADRASTNNAREDPRGNDIRDDILNSLGTRGNLRRAQQGAINPHASGSSNGGGYRPKTLDPLATRLAFGDAVPAMLGGGGGGSGMDEHGEVSEIGEIDAEAAKRLAEYQRRKSNSDIKSAQFRQSLPPVQAAAYRRTPSQGEAEGLERGEKQQQEEEREDDGDQILDISKFKETVAQEMRVRAELDRHREERRLREKSGSRKHQQKQQQQQSDTSNSGTTDLNLAATKSKANVVKIPELGLTLQELSTQLRMKWEDVVAKLGEMGEEEVPAAVEGASALSEKRAVLVEADVAELLALELNFSAERVATEGKKVKKSKAVDKRESAIVGDALFQSSGASRAEAVDLAPRAPVVSIMGHVDHGKTTLLDSLRQLHFQQQQQLAKMELNSAASSTTASKKGSILCSLMEGIAGSEAGGITQRLSAFCLRVCPELAAKMAECNSAAAAAASKAHRKNKGGKIPLNDIVDSAQINGESNDFLLEFAALSAQGGGEAQTRERKELVVLDTPGHAAFTSMRAHGTSATDVVVLVVAIDDGVMPQTVEAIRLAQATQCSIVVALNKIDKFPVLSERAEARNRVLTSLLQYDVMAEEYGGEVQVVEVSGLQGTGLPQLVESIMVQAEVMELAASKAGPAEAVVLDAKMERGRGVVADILLKWGALNTGDSVVVGNTYGKIKGMVNTGSGEPITAAFPSESVRILGLRSVPTTGQELIVVSSETRARQIAERRVRVQDLRQQQERDHYAMIEQRESLQRQQEKLQQLRDLAEKTGKNPKDITESELLAYVASETHSREGLQQQQSAGGGGGGSAGFGQNSIGVILKADGIGSLEALKKIVRDIEARTRNEVKIHIINASVGDISQTDIELASVSLDNEEGFELLNINGPNDQKQNQTTIGAGGRFLRRKGINTGALLPSTVDILSKSLNLGKGICAKSVILGFNVSMSDGSTRTAAKQNDVEVVRDSVIYRLEEELIRRVEDVLPKERKVSVEGTAEVLQLFNVSDGSRAGRQVAGLSVLTGRLSTRHEDPSLSRSNNNNNASSAAADAEKGTSTNNNNNSSNNKGKGKGKSGSSSSASTSTNKYTHVFRVLRKGGAGGSAGGEKGSGKEVVVLDGALAEHAELKRMKDTVREVESGKECGLTLRAHSLSHASNEALSSGPLSCYSGFQVGDLIECRRVEYIPKSLEAVTVSTDFSVGLGTSSAAPTVSSQLNQVGEARERAFDAATISSGPTSHPLQGEGEEGSSSRRVNKTALGTKSGDIVGGKERFYGNGGSFAQRTKA